MKAPRPRTNDTNEDHEELEGLLTPSAVGPDDWAVVYWRQIVGIALALIFLVVLGRYAPIPLLSSQISSHDHLYFNGDTLRSNGTHDFKRTVLIVSIDGLRCVSLVYISRKDLIPHS